ncbi:hypothetical protein G3R49_01080 [Shewanella sp. WXL01]|uniref:hypothetical protein n=1 Tax=Shewanella sp. WXL01 TaxID=2709721 RepID=UPI0014386613|nr:hypothetical protein [Shewanella sp. WXL01]NKF49169.1 hypothetical protein [Shewanella sp. WXL01]
MKKVIGLYILVVVVGVFTSTAVSEKVTEATFKLYSGATMIQMDYSLTLENSLAILEAYENSDEAAFYQSNCMQINLSLKALRLYRDNIKGMQQVRTESAITKGHEVLLKLEQSGKC